LVLEQTRVPLALAAATTTTTTAVPTGGRRTVRSKCQVAAHQLSMGVLSSFRVGAAEVASTSRLSSMWDTFRDIWRNMSQHVASEWHPLAGRVVVWTLFTIPRIAHQTQILAQWPSTVTGHGTMEYRRREAPCSASTLLLQARCLCKHVASASTTTADAGCRGGSGKRPQTRCFAKMMSMRAWTIAILFV
jgi:hypothetical protein